MDEVTGRVGHTYVERGLLARHYRHYAPGPTALELHLARGARVQGVVLADAHPVAGPEPRAALAHDDLAAGHGLPREHLDSEPLGVGVAAVARGSETLLMSHRCPPSRVRAAAWPRPQSRPRPWACPRAAASQRPPPWPRAWAWAWPRAGASGQPWAQPRPPQPRPERPRPSRPPQRRPPSPRPWMPRPGAPPP